MRAKLLLAAGLAIVAVAACAAFGSDDASAVDGADAAADASTADALADGLADGALAACTQLTPGAGPPPLHPDGGPPETSCGASNVDLETSPTNCGTCGRSCSGVPCVGGACATETLYVGTTQLGLRYARRGRFVLASATDAFDILPDGGDFRVIAAVDGGSGCCNSVSPDDGADWFFRRGDRADRIEPDGGVSATVSLVGTDTLSFVVTPTDLAYVAANGGGSNTSGIRAITKSGGVHHDIAASEPYATALVRDDGFLMWAQEPQSTGGAGATGPIVRHDLATSDTRRSGPVGASGALGFDADFIYYFDGPSRELRRMAKKNLAGAIGERLATWRGPEDDALAMSVFGDFVYVSLTTRGRPTATVIARVHRCGSEPIVVARDIDANLMGASILDDGKLYFVRYNRLQRTQP